MSQFGCSEVHSCVNSAGAEFLLNANELVVLGAPLGSTGSSSLDLPGAQPYGLNMHGNGLTRSAMKLSSVSPDLLPTITERSLFWHITAEVIDSDSEPN